MSLHLGSWSDAGKAPGRVLHELTRGCVVAVGLNWALKDERDLSDRMKMKEGILLPSLKAGACVSAPEAGLG